MAYRYGNRMQESLLPPSIEDYVAQEDPVRAYDVFFDMLDFAGLGIVEDEHQVGNAEYDPRAMLKLIAYGYSYGIRSSRKLERALVHNLSFMWLVGGLRPNYKTISEFRRRNRKSIALVLKQCARMCMKLGLVEGNTLFIDSTRMRANASLRNTWTEQRCRDALKDIDERVEAILKESEETDTREQEQGSLVCVEGMEEKQLRSKIRGILEELHREGRQSKNTVDADCVSTSSIHGAYAGYSAHIAVDGKNGLIANAEVVSSAVDQNALSEQVEKANEVVEKKCEYAVADGGYSGIKDVKKVIDSGVTPVLPLQRNIEKRKDFTYDEAKDCFTCPEGHMFHRSKTIAKGQWVYYWPKYRSICKTCCRFGVCTKSPYGRTVSRSLLEPIAEKVEGYYLRFRDIFSRRKGKAEHPFGYIRCTLGANGFLLRGTTGVNAEMSLMSTAFNIRRMITLLNGVKGFRAALAQ